MYVQSITNSPEPWGKLPDKDLLSNRKQYEKVILLGQAQSNDKIYPPYNVCPPKRAYFLWGKATAHRHYI